MSMDTVIDLGKACGRELSEAEAARLREIGNRLNLREDDALWPLLAAMEYQRIYYEGLRESDALGGLPYQHRTGCSSGGNSAHALRLAHQRAVSRGRVILRRFERKELRRRKKGDMETRNLGTITYFYRMQHVCLFNNILK